MALVNNLLLLFFMSLYILKYHQIYIVRFYWLYSYLCINIFKGYFYNTYKIQIYT